MTIDTVAAKVFPTLTRVEKFLSVAEQFLTVAVTPAWLWQVLLGHLSSLEKLVPHERLRMRSLQWHLKTHWSPESDPPYLPVPQSREVEEDLSWWVLKDRLLMGGSFRDACYGSSPVFGRFLVGVGRTPLRSICVLGVVGAGEFSAHQSPGDEGLVPGLAVLPGDGHRSSYDCDVRQLDGGCLRQQAGRDGLQLPLLIDQATSPMDRVLRCPVGGEVSSRAVQCSGQFPQPLGFWL